MHVTSYESRADRRRGDARWRVCDLVWESGRSRTWLMPADACDLVWESGPIEDGG